MKQCILVTKSRTCGQCDGRGEYNETYWETPCCQAKMLSSFGESYCSKCKKGPYENWGLGDDSEINCKYCGQEIWGGKGDYWHTNSNKMECENYDCLASPDTGDE